MMDDLPPPLLGRLNHVGIACPDLDAAIANYARLYGASVSRAPFDMPEQGVRVAFIDVANSQLELIEPLGDA
ncbi:VOC family protein, partial [Sandarakinorhabdus sp.]|uniref:VOC family protein n=1 Tax=Sandarakinorhabdus sp. TaxID=1916663 RepID=UPI00286D8CF0